jgi:chromosome segregation ATPase
MVFKMTKKKCNSNCACAHVDAKDTSFANVKDAYQVDAKETINYGFYSKILQKPFDSLSELMAAEKLYQDEQKAKEEKISQKKADAQKVEDAFKALNAARKVYKDDLKQLTKEYAEELENLKKAFDIGKEDIYNNLAEAEKAYEVALKEFTDKYDNYHMTLKDGDFETTIDKSSVKSSDTAENFLRMLFGAL